MKLPFAAGDVLLGYLRGLAGYENAIDRKMTEREKGRCKVFLVDSTKKVEARRAYYENLAKKDNDGISKYMESAYFSMGRMIKWFEEGINLEGRIKIPPSYNGQSI